MGEPATTRRRRRELSFRHYIAERQRQAPPSRKGERTRERIRLAAAELLNEVGYRQMKVADVCARAEITPPVLYRYFEGKAALTLDVLGEFLDRFMAVAGAAAPRTAFQAIYQANLRWIVLARANAGLMGCLLEVSEEVPEFDELFARTSRGWYRRITDSVLRRFPSTAVNRDQLDLVHHALGGMIDDLTRKLFTRRTPAVRSLVAKVASTDEALAAFLSALWFRALYACDPPADEVTPILPKLTVAAAGGGGAVRRASGRVRADRRGARIDPSPGSP